MRTTKITFSNPEIKQLVHAWLIVSLAFAIAQHGLKLSTSFLTAVVAAALTAGVGFLLHELGHKFLAQRYGATAAFRADYRMLGLGLLVSFFGWIILAPGAVYIHGHLSKKENGIIAAAGPGVNFLLGIIFAILLFVVPLGVGSVFFLYGLLINAWLGLFNLIPVAPFDGQKIWQWNKVAFFGLAIIGIILIYVQIIQ